MRTIRRVAVGVTNKLFFTIVLLAAPFTTQAYAQAPGESDTHLDSSSNTALNLPEAPMPSTIANATQAVPPSDSADDELTVKKLPVRFLSDEWHIVKSPASLRKEDLRWLLPLAGATVAAFATDTHVMRDVVSRNPSFNDANSTSSDILRDSAIGVPVLLFGAGALSHNERSRETGLLAGEAMIDAYVFDEAIKYITLRERPSTDNARGRFFTGDAASDPSFISGHSIVTWSSAAVLAGEYSRPWQQAAIYTMASGVSLTRVLGQQHFPSDTLLGSAAGWLIGHYVYRAHHRRVHYRAGAQRP